MPTGGEEGEAGECEEGTDTSSLWSLVKIRVGYHKPTTGGRVTAGEPRIYYSWRQDRQNTVHQHSECRAAQKSPIHSKPRHENLFHHFFKFPLDQRLHSILSSTSFLTFGVSAKNTLRPSIFLTTALCDTRMGHVCHLSPTCKSDPSPDTSVRRVIFSFREKERLQRECRAR